MTSEGITPKLERFQDDLKKLDELPRATFEEFMADFRSLDSALRRLQAAIQALIDVCCLAAARLGVPARRTSRELLEELEAGGHLPVGSAARFGPMFSFRNRVVHLYERIGPAIVFRIAREDRGELKELMRLLVLLLEEPGDDQRRIAPGDGEPRRPAG